MKQFLIFIMAFLLAASICGQGSPTIIPPWEFTGAKAFLALESGDTLYAYDTSVYLYLRIRGNNTRFLFKDSVYFNNYVSMTNLAASNIYSWGPITFDNIYTPSPLVLYNPVGPGMVLTDGVLGTTIGPLVDSIDLSPQSVKFIHEDSTGQRVFTNYYKKTSAVAESSLVTYNFATTTLMGYPVPGTSPPDANGLFFNVAQQAWNYGAGGAGGGGPAQKIDTGYSNGEGIWTPATGTLYTILDTGLYALKGTGSNDTAHMYLDWIRVQRNDGTRDVRVFKTTDGTELLRMEDSSTFTKMTTTNTSGWKFIYPIRVTSLVLDGSVPRVTGILQLVGSSSDGTQMEIYDADALGLQTLVTDKAVNIGSDGNFRFLKDSLTGRGPQSQLKNFGSLSGDTIKPGVVLRLGSSDSLRILGANGDTVEIIYRNETNDTTVHQFVSGQTIFRGPAGLGAWDSLEFVGHVYFGGLSVAKQKVDSAMHLQADTTISKITNKLLGSTSGSVQFKARAVAGSTVYIVPPDSAAGLVLSSADGAGTLKWIAGGTGGGNSLSDLDSSSSPILGTTGARNNNVLKGNGDSAIFYFQKRPSNHVAILPGAGLTFDIGDTIPGCPVMDTSVRVVQNLFFGSDQNDTSRFSGTRLYNLRRNDYYFHSGDLSLAPGQLLTAGIKQFHWLPDTAAGIDTTNVAYLTAMVDSSGASFTPLRFMFEAREYDSIFQFVFNGKTSVADTALAGVTKLVLVINEAPVDSVSGANVNFSATSITTETIDFTDRLLAPGDRVMIKLYCRFDPTAATRSVTIRDARIGMRKR